MGKNSKDKIVYVLFLTSAALVFALVVWSGNFRSRSVNRTGMRPTDFSKGWTLVTDGTEQQVTLPYQANSAPNQIIELHHEIPDLEDEGTALSFHSSFAAVWVYAGDKLLYEYDTASLRPFGKASPSRWNMVKISNEYNGETLRILLQSPYARYSGAVTRVWIGDILELTGFLVRTYMPQFLICGAFFLLGIGLIVSSVLLRRMLNDVCTLRCLGVFIVLASLWMMSEVDFPDILWDISYTAFLARYLFVMVCPIPYLMYLLHRFPRRYSPCFRTLAVIFSLNLFVLTVLQIANLADFVETVIITHFWIIVLFLCMSVILFQRIRTERPLTFDFVLECMGILVITASILVEIYLYHEREYMRSGNYLRLGLFGYIGCLFTALLLDILKKQEDAERLGKELQESRLRLMVSQIQPHFIYNTLSSIRTLIKLNPNQAYDLVYDFSKYLRANIDSIGQEGTVSFAKELEHIKNYCRIEQIRFGKKLKVLYEIEEDRFLVPPLTIQPLVENAIKHGIRGKAGGGTVKIHSFKRDNGYVVEVLDDGVGFDTSADSPPGSAGLSNIRFRLKEIGNSNLEITSIAGKGTKAVVTVPDKIEWTADLTTGGIVYENDSSG